MPMLLDVDILAGRDFEDVGFQRAEKFAGDVFAFDPVGHVLVYRRCSSNRRVPRTTLSLPIGTCRNPGGTRT